MSDTLQLLEKCIREYPDKSIGRHMVMYHVKGQYYIGTTSGGNGPDDYPYLSTLSSGPTIEKAIVEFSKKLDRQKPL